MARTAKQVAAQLKAARASAAKRRKRASAKRRDAQVKRSFAEHSDLMKLHDSRRARVVRSSIGR